MTTLQVIFYLFATVAVLAGVMVVTAKNAMHSVLFLVLSFFGMAGIWVLLNAEFLALILVLVYVGAVMTLFLFVIMMLNLDKTPSREGFVRYLPFAAIITFTMVGLIIMVVGPEHFGLSQVAAPSPHNADYSNTADLGAVLYTEYAYPFEIAGALLLVAIIAAITLTHRVPQQRQVQNVAKQIATKRENRVRLIDMPSEKKIKPTSTGQ